METRLKRRFLFTLAALLIAGETFVSCVDNVVEEPTNGDGTFTMTVTATKDASTKALTPNGTKIDATWAAGEKVYVYNATTGATLDGYLEPQSYNASTTTLRGDLTGTITANDDLILKFLSPNYTGQNGTLSYIATHCDYAEAAVKVKSVTADRITTTANASFVNKQAIVKFTLIDNADGTTPVNATQLTVSDGTNTYLITPGSATNELYVALPSFSDKTVTLNASDGNYNYSYEKSGVSFTNGQYYAITVKASALQGSGKEGDPYLISSESDWSYLASKVNNGNAFSSKFFRQTANINVTTMVGEGESKPFSGTYDGNGNTLNLNLDATVRYTAPFQSIVNATIKNVVTTGTVHATDNHASGLVGFTDGTCTIQNCRVGANVGGPQYLGGIVGHCWHANISIIGCVYTGTLTPANGQKTGGILGWGGDDGGHTITISNCLFAGTLANTSTKFNPIGTLYEKNNTDNTKNLSNTYYTLGANISDDDNNSFVKGLSYKGKFARSITGGSDVTVANAGAETIYDVSGITSYGTGIKYGGVLYAGNGEAVNLTLSHGAAPTGFSFSQYTVTGGGSLANPTTNSPTLTMTDADQTINAQWSSLTFNYTGAEQTFTVPATGYYTLTCYGAQGGAFTTTRGGYGGTAQLTYLLTQGSTLHIYVGGQGVSIADYSGHPEGGNGGWNGGGKGGTGVSWQNGGSTPYSGGGGGGGATHIATSAVGAITSSTSFSTNQTNLLLIAGGGGGGCAKGEGGNAGGATGAVGSHNDTFWSIDWNNGSLSCGENAMLSSWGDSSCEGCGGGGAGYIGGNTWDVQYNENEQCYSGAGGSSWGDETNGKGYSTTSGGATAGGNGKAVITWYGTTYQTE